MGVQEVLFARRDDWPIRETNDIAGTRSLPHFGPLQRGSEHDALEPRSTRHRPELAVEDAGKFMAEFAQGHYDCECDEADEDDRRNDPINGQLLYQCGLPFVSDAGGYSISTLRCREPGRDA